AQILNSYGAEENRDHGDLVLDPGLCSERTPVIQNAFAPTEVEAPVAVLLQFQQKAGTVRDGKLGIENDCDHLGPPQKPNCAPPDSQPPERPCRTMTVATAPAPTGRDACQRE